MAASTEIRRPKLEVANNGFMVEWEEVVSTNVKGQSYENRTYKTKNEIFEKQATETGDQCLDRAIVKWKEIFKQSQNFIEKAEDIY